MSLFSFLRKKREENAPAQSPIPSINFDHTTAQQYELASGLATIKEHFEELYTFWDKARGDDALWPSPDDLWFQGDTELFYRFFNYVKDRKCLEIGSGPFGYLSACYKFSDRIIIEPLIDQYRQAELDLIGKTFFTEDIKTFNINAEQFVEELRNAVDGCIVCQNTLDHCEDPLLILENIAEYAASGCYLLLWTDIWHLRGLDAGHRNITRSEAALDKMLEGLGFTIVKLSKKVRDPNECIEFGRLACKV